MRWFQGNRYLCDSGQAKSLPIPDTFPKTKTQPSLSQPSQVSNPPQLLHTAEVSCVSSGSTNKNGDGDSRLSETVCNILSKHPALLERARQLASLLPTANIVSMLYSVRNERLVLADWSEILRRHAALAAATAPRDPELLIAVSPDTLVDDSTLSNMLTAIRRLRSLKWVKPYEALIQCPQLVSGPWDLCTKNHETLQAILPEPVLVSVLEEFPSVLRRPDLVKHIEQLRAQASLYGFEFEEVLQAHGSLLAFPSARIERLAFYRFKKRPITEKVLALSEARFRSRFPLWRDKLSDLQQPSK